MTSRQLPEYVWQGSCAACLEVWGQRQHELLTQIDNMRAALLAARPFIATEARLVNFGVGHPGSGTAPAVLASIDALLEDGA